MKAKDYNDQEECENEHKGTPVQSENSPTRTPTVQGEKHKHKKKKR